MVLLFLRKYALLAGGYALAGLFLWLYIGAKSDTAAQIERCETEKQSAARSAQEAVNAALIDSYEKRLAEAEKMVKQADAARLIAVEAAEEAERRPERVRTVVREVASENSCIDTVVPGAVLDSLRNPTDRCPTGDCRGPGDEMGWDSLGLDAPVILTDDP